MRRQLLLTVVALSLCPLAWGQVQLNNTQLQVLKSAIVADPALNAHPNTPDGNFALATCLNLLTTAACVAPGPAAGASFTSWKLRVQIDEIGDNINAAELAGLSTLNATRLQTLVAMSSAGINPTVANRRAFFDDIFSGAGGAQTRAALLVLWKRLTTRGEKILALGVGSDASPASLTFEGALTYQTVEAARNLP